MLELNIYIIGEKINFTLPGQDGIWVKFYHFWAILKHPGSSRFGKEDPG